MPLPSSPLVAGPVAGTFDAARTLAASDDDVLGQENISKRLDKIVAWTRTARADRRHRDV